MRVNDGAIVTVQGPRGPETYYPGEIIPRCDQDSAEAMEAAGSAVRVPLRPWRRPQRMTPERAAVREQIAAMTRGA